MSEPKKRFRMVCGTCGSTDVRCDAYGAWNEDAQEWEIAATFDKGAYCNACDGETSINEQEITPAPEGATP